MNLKRKIGPLPLWVILVAVAGLGTWLYIRHRAAGTGASTSDVLTTGVLPASPQQGASAGAPASNAAPVSQLSGDVASQLAQNQSDLAAQLAQNQSDIATSLSDQIAALSTQLAGNQHDQSTTTTQSQTVASVSFTPPTSSGFFTTATPAEAVNRLAAVSQRTLGNQAKPTTYVSRAPKIIRTR